jgi:hydrogenase-4 membrane subunit HyfE
MITIFGEITPPPAIKKYIFYEAELAGKVPGLVTFLNNIVKLLIVVAGLYALFNLIIAGYQFMSAGGEPKSIEKAWAKIWQSLVGLLIIAGAFILAAIFGYLIFGDPSAILIPQIYGPE